MMLAHQEDCQGTARMYLSMGKAWGVWVMPTLPMDALSILHTVE